LIIVPEDGYK